ncbi:Eco57I restriction-modification methylase domain-containing protein [Okeania sp.]|uniref:Eco57I restriction-modification methylase domain-containing protein n=1 Tax=Okeania sp. TaxID=3100323 RepID=UPI002B4B4DC7|nr:N-6 DNA methylase [Okeania sp.]MEB3343314.1 N-6 DNA methylase [Okeania sp.]
MKFNYLYETKIITNNQNKPYITSEFQDVFYSLVVKLKNSQLKDFLIENILDNSTQNIKLDVTNLEVFAKSRSPRLGAFYTSDNLVNKIISQIEIKPYFKYLDPATGTGNFVLILAKELLTKYSFDFVDEILNLIYGFDLDWEALEICKVRFLLELEKFFKIDISTYQNLNFYQTDFTVKATQGFDFINDFNIIYKDSKQVINIKKDLKFDYIFGNPPFITFYGRRSKKLPESHRKYYLSNYEFIPDSVKNGKLNLYMFFIEHGLNLLKTGGDLIYLLDNSIYETSAYYLRKWIIKNFQIKYIQMGLTNFENVASGQTIWHIRNIYPEKPVLIEDFSQHKIREIDRDKWLKDVECRIGISDYNSILDKLAQNKLLVDYFPRKSIRTCCMLLNLTEKFLVTKEDYQRDKSGLIMPYLEGGKSLLSPDKPFEFFHYLKYDYELQLRLSEEIRVKLDKEGIKNKKRIGLGQLEIYRSPKIFIRQSSDRLIAKFTNENLMANNSLYVLTPIYSNFRKEDWENILIYTELLLNSKLYLYLAYQMNIIRKNPKQQPQIKVSDLKRLPFWLDEKSLFFKEVISMIDRNKIDSLIYQELKFTDREISEIESFSLLV